MKKVKFTLNGKEVSTVSSPSKPLLDVLREEFELNGSKECCGKGECGSCTVLLDDEAVVSCLVLLGQVDSAHVTTIEGIGTTSSMDILQEAFLNEGATQCGYCTPGFIVMAKEFLNRVERMPTTDEIMTALGGNLCRCTGYTKIIEAVKNAVLKKLETQKEINLN